MSVPVWLLFGLLHRETSELKGHFKDTQHNGLVIFFISQTTHMETFYNASSRPLRVKGALLLISPAMHIELDLSWLGLAVTLIMGHLPLWGPLSRLQVVFHLLVCPSTTAPAPALPWIICTTQSKLPPHSGCLHGNNFSLRRCVSIKLDDQKSTGTWYVFAEC